MAEIQSENDALRKAAHAAKKSFNDTELKLKDASVHEKALRQELAQARKHDSDSKQEVRKQENRSFQARQRLEEKEKECKMLSKALSKAQAESDRLSSELSESRSECQDLEKVITEVRSKALSSSDAMEVAAKKREKIEARLRRAMESLKAAEAASAEKDKIIMAAKKKAKQAVSDGRRLQNAKREEIAGIHAELQMTKSRLTAALDDKHELGRKLGKEAEKRQTLSNKLEKALHDISQLKRAATTDKERAARQLRMVEQRSHKDMMAQLRRMAAELDEANAIAEAEREQHQVTYNALQATREKLEEAMGRSNDLPRAEAEKRSRQRTTGEHTVATTDDAMMMLMTSENTRKKTKKKKKNQNSATGASPLDNDLQWDEMQAILAKNKSAGDWTDLAQSAASLVQLTESRHSNLMKGGSTVREFNLGAESWGKTSLQRSREDEEEPASAAPEAMHRASYSNEEEIEERTRSFQDKHNRRAQVLKEHRGARYGNASWSPDEADSSGSGSGRPPRAPTAPILAGNSPKANDEAFADSGVAAAGVDFGQDSPSQRIADVIRNATQFVRQRSRQRREKSLLKEDD